MPSFIMADENLPFAIALTLLVFIALAELVALTFGGSLSGAADSLSHDTDVHAPGLDAKETALSSLLSWLRVGQVPVLALLVIALFCFGMTGYAVQSVAQSLTGGLLPASLASIPAAAAALPGIRIIGGGLARILPREETSAVPSSSFVGRMATITLGTAARASPAQAKLRDAHGQAHYVMVEPDADGERFIAGEAVLLVRQNGALFYAIRNDNTYLQGSA